MTSRASSAEQRRQFASQVKAAIAEAHDAARIAVETLTKAAQLDEEGRVFGECGSVLLRVLRPSFRLRAVLKDLGEISNFDRHGWPIRSLPPSIGQTLLAQETACQAAKEVLQKRLTGEGEFYCKLWEN